MDEWSEEIPLEIRLFEEAMRQRNYWIHQTFVWMIVAIISNALWVLVVTILFLWSYYES